MLDTLYGALKNAGGIDVIHLRHVREGSFASQFAQHHLCPAGYHETAPCMDLTAFANDDAYLARYSKVQRRRRKKIGNAIEKLGDVTFNALSSGPTFIELLDNVVGNKQVWIEQRGLISEPLRDPRLVGFLETLAGCQGAGLKPVITSLKADGRCISHEIGLRYRGRHAAFITGHDPQLTSLSPARLHMDHSQRLALADGMSTFDLMVPGDPYKASWSSHAVAVADYASALSLRGRIHHTANVQLLRPAARFAYRNSPAWLRQKAMPLVHGLYAK